MYHNISSVTCNYILDQHHPTLIVVRQCDCDTVILTPLIMIERCQ